MKAVTPGRLWCALTLALALVMTGALTVPSLAASPPLIPGESTGDDPDEEWWEGIVLPETGVLPEAEAHPSLYFSADEIETVRARALGEVPDPHGFYAGNWERVVADADRWLEEPISTNDDEKGRAAKALAFAWIVTSDSRYRDHAVANLMAAFEDLQTTDQYVAMQMTNYAVAYDWVMAEGVSQEAGAIPDADVEQMRSSIKIGADWMDEYLDSPGVRSHNHRSKVAAAQGSWAMAFSSDPDAQAYLDKGMANLNRVWSYMFTKDGIYRDGGGYYWIFTVINSTPFLWHYLNAADQDLFPLVQPAFEWQLKTSNPRGWMPNVEDGWYKHNWLVTVASAYAQTETSLHPTASLGELFQWRFFATDHEPVRYPDDFTGARNQYYAFPDEIVLYDSTLAEVQPDDASGTIDFDQGPRGGVTMFRSDWDFAQPSTRWAYFEGTAMSNNHDHADALQFLIDAEDTILANDNGYGPQRFGGRNDWKGPENHNVITADGAALGDPTPTRHFIDTPFFDFAEKSASYYDDDEASHTRAIAFPGEDYFVVIDDLSATTDKDWVSRYHNRGELVGAGNRWTWTTEAGPWGEEAQMHSLMLPADAAVSTAQSQFNPYGDGATDAGEQYPDPSTDVEPVTRLEMSQTGAEAQYLMVLVPGATEETAPALDDLSAGAVNAAQVVLADAVDVFGARPEAGEIAAADVLGHGTFVWVRHVGDALQHLAGRDMTSMSVDGVEWVSTDRPVSLSLDVAEARTWTGQIARDTEGSTALTLALPAERVVASATLDGESVPVEHEGDTATLHLPSGGDLVIEFSDVDQTPAAPADLAGAYRDQTIELTWPSVPTATSYDVLRDEEVVATVPAPSFRDAEVTLGQTYVYQVLARNEAGESPASDAVQVTAALTAPAVPTGLQTTASDSMLALSWNRSQDAEQYVVTRTEDDGEPVQVTETSLTSFTDTGLVNGTSYSYSVEAFNEAGASGASAWVSGVPIAQAPSAPSGLRTSRAEAAVVLSWDRMPRAESYSVARSSTPGEGYAVIADGLIEASYTDTEVVSGETYYYVVTASNSAGTSQASREALAIADCTPTFEIADGVPSYVEAEHASVSAGAFVAYDDPERSGGVYLQSEGGSGAGSAPSGEDFLRFDLEIDEPGAYHLWLLGQGDDASSDSFWIQIDGQEPFQAIMDNSAQWRWKTAAGVAHLDGGFQTLTVHHRETGTRVDKLLLVPDQGYTPEGLGGEALVAQECEDPGEDPEPPQAPTGLSVAESDGTVTLGWDGVAGAQSYQVLRTTEIDGGWEVLAEDLSERAYTDGEVVSGTTYAYGVLAVNDVGSSERSATAAVTVGCTPTYQLTRHEPLWIAADAPSDQLGSWIVHEDEELGSWIQLDPDAEWDAPASDWLRYDLEVSEPGEYALWYRGQGFDTNSDSLWLQVDGEPLVQAGLGTVGWNWRQPSVLSLTEGSHTLWLRNREPGAAMHQLLLTANLQFQPSGFSEFVATPSACGQCPDPDQRDSVVIGGVDTGVANRIDEHGCTINDLIDDDGEYRGHGAWVSHVITVTRQLVHDGLLSGEERRVLVDIAVQQR